MLALGLLGDSSAVSVLLGLLGDSELAAPASIALYLITGADLMTASPVVDTTAFEDEASFGDDADDVDLTTPRISESPDDWYAWWTTHGERFQASERYRLGEPYSTEVAAACLQDTRLPLVVRQWVADEIVIRYRVDFAYAPDMAIADQMDAFSSLRATLSGRVGGVRAGRWDFGR